MVPSMLGLSIDVRQGFCDRSRWDTYKVLLLAVERVEYVLRAWEKKLTSNKRPSL
jgi:hypothetical protein